MLKKSILLSLLSCCSLFANNTLELGKGQEPCLCYKEMDFCFTMHTDKWLLPNKEVHTFLHKYVTHHPKCHCTGEDSYNLDDYRYIFVFGDQRWCYEPKCEPKTVEQFIDSLNINHESFTGQDGHIYLVNGYKHFAKCPCRLKSE